jgi:hypothetical protein
MTVHRNYIVAVFCAFLVAGPLAVQAQQTKKPDMVVVDSLFVNEVWWLGGRIYGTVMQQFGRLTMSYAGSTAPGATGLKAAMDGGSGYGGGFQAVVEYRAPDRPWTFVGGIGGEYRYATAESSTLVSEGIYAFNARYEGVSSVLYIVPAFEARLRLSKVGAYAMVGVQVDVPVLGEESALWQHEEANTPRPNGEPGFPNTSIKFRSSIEYSTRVGLQLGVGHDFMVGLFGYRKQLITPFASIYVGTPVTSVPTSWNSAMLRVGIMWRKGLD